MCDDVHEKLMTRDDWLDYLSQRTGTYEYRTRRYAAVADKLELLGLEDGDLVVDVGAGMCEFGRYLYRDRGWSGQYLAVDGAIDGVDLERWSPLALQLYPHFFVAIEVLEHLDRWRSLTEEMTYCSLKGVAATTPNAGTLGDAAVLAMDETHVSPLTRDHLTDLGFNVELASLFNRGDDTLVAWRRGGRK